jgi:hypothetical protein
VVRAWGGVGSLQIASDLVETTNNATYYGVGEIVDLPDLEQLINGVAQRAEFILSGAAVDSRLIQIANEEAETVRRGRVNIGLVFFDQDWQLALPTKWVWEGYADSLDPEADPRGGQRVRRLRLSVGSAFTGRRRPNPAYYTDLSQQARSSGDLFCERVNLYKQEQNKAWPRV